MLSFLSARILFGSFYQTFVLMQRKLHILEQMFIGCAAVLRDFFLGQGIYLFSHCIPIFFFIGRGRCHCDQLDTLFQLMCRSFPVSLFQIFQEFIGRLVPGIFV